jgi:hypothetical protein
MPLAAVLASCGTVSDVNPVAGSASKTFSRVVVRDFKYQGAADEQRGPASALNFSNLISSEVSGQNVFGSVARGGRADSNTLVIDGEVTRFVEGNAALRAIVGLGAGSSYFDANVRFIDGGTGTVLGTMNADKNSWVLGGGLAAGQTVEAFMNGAAEKVGNESVQFAKVAAQR